MIHPHTEIKFISPEKGYGVVATKFIPKGTVTWVLDKLDRVFTEKDVAEMAPLYKKIIDTYTFRDCNGNYILCWDNARFVNHSFNSNCITTAYDFEIAVRDIHPGEELTDDYGYLNITEPFEGIEEEGSERRVVHPDDLLRFFQVWDEKLIEAFRYFLDNEQPLKSILEPQTLEKSIKIAKGEYKMDSILNCYFDSSERSKRLNELNGVK